MSEPFFGSGQPMWTGIPAPAFTWFQPPIPVANRPVSAPMAFAPPTIAPGPVLPGISQFAVPGAYPALNAPDFVPSPNAAALLGATAIRRGQPMGPANDQEVEEFIYDTFDLLPGTNDVEARCEGGRVTLTGNVHHKRLKRDVGEIAWAIPGVSDVQNNVTITTRRRTRAAGRDQEPATPPIRKQA